VGSTNMSPWPSASAKAPNCGIPLSSDAKSSDWLPVTEELTSTLPWRELPARVRDDTAI
jgi:hypothetical protein